MSDRFEQLAPRDVAITLASLGRRFEGVVASASGESRLVALHDAPGPDGASFDAIITEAAQAVSFLANEVERSVQSQEPVVPAAAIDPSERSFLDSPASPPPSESVDAIRTAASAAGAHVDDASSDTLGRSVAVAGGGTTTPIALAREMARTGVGFLQRAEKQADWLRTQV